MVFAFLVVPGIPNLEISVVFFQDGRGVLIWLGEVEEANCLTLFTQALNYPVWVLILFSLLDAPVLPIIELVCGRNWLVSELFPAAGLRYSFSLAS